MDSHSNARVVCGVDIGGTFTDCVIRAEDGRTGIGKALSSPGDGYRSGFFARSVGDALRVVRDGDASKFACGRCGHDMGEADGSYKLALIMEEQPVADVLFPYSAPATFVDAEVVFRRFYCPGCARQLASEVARAGDQPLADIRLYSRAEER